MHRIRNGNGEQYVPHDIGDDIKFFTAQYIQPEPPDKNHQHINLAQHGNGYLAEKNHDKNK